MISNKSCSFLPSDSNNNTVAYWMGLQYEDLENEFVGGRTIISTFAEIPLEDIKGVRVPILQLPGNSYFQVLENDTFEYDSSWPTRQFMNPGMWPYSLDYSSIQVKKRRVFCFFFSASSNIKRLRNGTCYFNFKL